MVCKEFTKNAEVCGIPMKLSSKLEVVESVSTVTTLIANEMNNDYRRNCEIHDSIDMESQILADTIYAEA